MVINVFFYRWFFFLDKKVGNKIVSICECFGVNVLELEKKLLRKIVIKLGKLWLNLNLMDDK